MDRQTLRDWAHRFNAKGPAGLINGKAPGPVHVMGGNLPIEDDDGMLFSDTSDAVAHAAIVANDLADDDHYRGYAVVVVDVCENVIARVPISPSHSRDLKKTLDA
jgi:hypothetical protein